MLTARTKTLNLTYFPLVVALLPVKVDGSYVDDLESDHRVLFQMRARYVSLSDTTQVTGIPDAVARKRMADWTKSHDAELKQWQVANALLVPSSVVRTALTAVHWFAPPTVPTTIEVDRAAALGFLRTQAERAGISTAELDRYARL